MERRLVLMMVTHQKHILALDMLNAMKISCSTTRSRIDIHFDTNPQWQHCLCDLTKVVLGPPFQGSALTFLLRCLALVFVCSPMCSFQALTTVLDQF